MILFKTQHNASLYSFFALWIAATAANPSSCVPLTPDSEPFLVDNIADFFFGADQDPAGAGNTIFEVPWQFNWATCCSASPSWYTDQWIWFDAAPDARDVSIFDSFASIYINGVPVVGGKNWTNDQNLYVPLATHVCSSDNQTSTWGPAYPDLRNAGWVTGRYQNLEVYIQLHVPQITSYMRHTVFITNKGSSAERLTIQQSGYSNPNGLVDIAPTTQNRYMIPYRWLLNDPALDPDYNTTLMSVHTRGSNARDNSVNYYMDNDDSDYGWNYAGNIEAGETKALMFVYAFGRNTTIMLEKAAWVDQQKPEMFNSLNADQLSQIVNWDACQVALGPDVNVTITPPTTCSSGLTSDFTVKVDTAREDFTADFMHRVILAAGDVTVVAPTSSTTLSVLNDVGALTHQLWYNGCIIKQTSFSACAKVEAPVAATAPSAQSVPVATPAKKSDATLLSVSAASLIALALF